VGVDALAVGVLDPRRVDLEIERLQTMIDVAASIDRAMAAVPAKVAAARSGSRRNS